MEYQNRQPKEGINVTRHNPFSHFLKLLAAALVLVVVCVVALNYLGVVLAKHVPFRYETALMEKVEFEFGTNEPQALVDYLNSLAARLSEHMSIAEDVQFAVHYNSDNVFNAFATLGGNIVFYRELLRNMPNENALAMVMAHEMSHVLHRDALAGASGGVASMLALMMLTGSTNFSGDVLTQTGSLARLRFSREMESAADRAALNAVAELYGHVAGADTLFRVLQSESDSQPASDEQGDNVENVRSWLSEFSRSHPLDENRIAQIARIAQENKWSLSGELTPLPKAYRQWLRE